MSLPKYANLEYDPNNIVQASKTIMNYDKQYSANLASDNLPTGTSGIPPKNEYEEFNSNLTEINTAILELKTYVQDSISKELNALNELQFSQQEDEHIYDQALEKIQQNHEGEGEAINPEDDAYTLEVALEIENIKDKLRKRYNREHRNNPKEQVSKEYNQLLRREATKIGAPHIINKINLHSANVNIPSGVVVGSGRHKIRKLYGGGQQEQKAINQQIENLNSIIESDKDIVRQFLDLEKRIQISKVGSQEREQADQEFSDLAESLLSEDNVDFYPDFPDTTNIEEIIIYFTKKVDSEFQDIKALKEQLKTDILQTGQEELTQIETATTSDIGSRIATLQGYLDTIDKMSAQEYKDLKNSIPTIIPSATKKENAPIRLQKEIARLKSELPSYIERAQAQPRGITEKELLEQEKQTRFIEARQRDELKQISDDFDDAIQDINDRIADIKRQKKELDDYIEQREKEEAILNLRRTRQERKDNELQFKSDMARLRQEKADAKQREKELEDEAEALERARLKAEKDAQDDAEKEFKQLQYEAQSRSLQERKALGKLAENTPRINPIISLLSKLTNLVSKTNVLFNSKIRKNISLLDRLDVEDMVRKFNAVVDNFNQVNSDYIVVAIDNGQELLNQTVNAMNKLGLDVSNGVQTYTKSLKGGSRHINNHLQHYKNVQGGQRLMMNQNPNIYKYML